MSARREPSTPPTIPGYDVDRLLGMGGFADVFLYTQRMPRRSVAVKVLLASSLGADVAERFRTEADLMARLSHHPSIVTIHHADVAADGRPYLVMEFCSRPGLGQRYRAERMGVAEVLRIGVRLASAVETAHRAGILHRDIKPANVLVTDFGWPALTDFGIAATTGLAAGAATGMSIPWSPPEMLAEHPAGDERSDVYSLAATVYSLLARRSPFEVPDGRNGAADLIARIERSPLAPTGRGDVPESLQHVLERAMDKQPSRRHPSAVAFARALQQVEAELMLPLTPLDLPEEVLGGAVLAEEGGVGGAGADPDATRLRPVTSISPERPAQPVPVASVSSGGPSSSAAATAAGAPGTVTQAAGPGLALEEHADVPEAWRAAARDVRDARPSAAEHAARRRRVVAGVVSGVVVLAALGGAAALSLGGGDEPAPDPQTQDDPTAEPSAPVVAVPSPTDLQGTLAGDGSATFTWTNPSPQDRDQFLWGVVRPGEETALALVTEPRVTVPVAAGAEPGAQVCIEVAVMRADRRYSTEPAVGCTG